MNEPGYAQPKIARRPNGDRLGRKPAAQSEPEACTNRPTAGVRGVSVRWARELFDEPSRMPEVIIVPVRFCEELEEQPIAVKGGLSC